MINHQEIKMNPTKAHVVVDLQPPHTVKEIQRLTEMIAAFSWLVSKSTDKCYPFFQALKGIGKINWVDKCKEAFQCLKIRMASSLLLSKLFSKEVLYMYLEVSEKAVNSVLAW